MDRIGSTIPPYNIVLPVLQSLHLNYDLDWRSRVRHYPFRIVTPALTCIEMGSQQNTKTTPFAVHTSQVTHLRLHGFYIPDHYPALKVLQIDLIRSTTRALNIWDIRTMMGFVFSHPLLETIEINTREGQALHPDSIWKTMEKKLRERGMVTWLLLSTRWVTSMPAYAYKHVSAIHFYSSNSAIC